MKSSAKTLDTLLCNEEKRNPEEYTKRSRRKRKAFQKKKKLDKENTEEEIKKWSTGKDKALEEVIAVTKERYACQNETCDMGITVRNHKQAIFHSSKEHEKCASGVQSEADTIQEEKTRLLDQVKMMQK